MLKSANQNTMQHHEITQLIIGKAIEVHKFLGKGLLESAYRECLYYELKNAGLAVEREKPMPVVYKEVKLEYGYRIDLLVENTVVIELKSVNQLHELHFAQTLTYMKLGQYKTGLLINFNVPMLKDGLKRLVLS